jgi:hypothetical protein
MLCSRGPPHAAGGRSKSRLAAGPSPQSGSLRWPEGTRSQGAGNLSSVLICLQADGRPHGPGETIFTERLADRAQRPNYMRLHGVQRHRVDRHVRP